MNNFENVQNKNEGDIDSPLTLDEEDLDTDIDKVSEFGDINNDEEDDDDEIVTESFEDVDAF